MKKSAKHLAIEHDFIRPMDYYDYIIESYRNGQHQQVAELFDQLRKVDQKFFLKHCLQFDIYDNVQVYHICLDVLFDKKH